MDLFAWLPGRTPPVRRLLDAYADELLPHAGLPGALTPAQCRENLDSFVASIERRVARLQAFAAALGTSLPAPANDRRQVEPVSQALDRLGKAHLRAVDAATRVFAGDWQARLPEGADRRLHTFALDLGTYCGEWGRHCVPRYSWIVDDSPGRRRDAMPTVGRVVIGHDPAVEPRPMANPVDAIAIAAFALEQLARHRSSPSLWRPNYFHFLSALADGAHR